MLKRAQPAVAAVDASKRAQRLGEAVALQEIEGNPLTEGQIALFEQFAHEGWTDEQALALILQRHLQPA